MVMINSNFIYVQTLDSQTQKNFSCEADTDPNFEYADMLKGEQMMAQRQTAEKKSQEPGGMAAENKYGQASFVLPTFKHIKTQMDGLIAIHLNRSDPARPK